MSFAGNRLTLILPILVSGASTPKVKAFAGDPCTSDGKHNGKPIYLQTFTGRSVPGDPARCSPTPGGTRAAAPRPGRAPRSPRRRTGSASSPTCADTGGHAVRVVTAVAGVVWWALGGVARSAGVSFASLGGVTCRWFDGGGLFGLQKMTPPWLQLGRISSGGCPTTTIDCLPRHDPGS